MNEIDRLIEQLHSPSRGKRYEACEYLRIAPSLPQLAMDALREATFDPEAEVAYAARHAIATHRGPDGSSGPGFLVPAVRQAIPDKHRTLSFTVTLIFSMLIATLGTVWLDATRPEFDLTLPAILGPWSFCFVFSLGVGTRCGDAAASFSDVESWQVIAKTILFAAVAGIALGAALFWLSSLPNGKWQWGSGDW